MAGVRLHLCVCSRFGLRHGGHFLEQTRTVFRKVESGAPRLEIFLRLIDRVQRRDAFFHQSPLCPPWLAAWQVGGGRLPPSASPDLRSRFRGRCSRTGSAGGYRHPACRRVVVEPLRVSRGATRRLRPALSYGPLPLSLRPRTAIAARAGTPRTQGEPPVGKIFDALS